MHPLTPYSTITASPAISFAAKPKGQKTRDTKKGKKDLRKNASAQPAQTPPQKPTGTKRPLPTKADIQEFVVGSSFSPVAPNTAKPPWFTRYEGHVNTALSEANVPESARPSVVLASSDTNQLTAYDPVAHSIPIKAEPLMDFNKNLVIPNSEELTQFRRDAISTGNAKHEVTHFLDIAQNTASLLRDPRAFFRHVCTSYARNAFAFYDRVAISRSHPALIGAKANDLFNEAVGRVHKATNGEGPLSIVDIRKEARANANSPIGYFLDRLSLPYITVATHNPAVVEFATKLRDRHSLTDPYWSIFGAVGGKEVSYKISPFEQRADEAGDQLVDKMLKARRNTGNPDTILEGIMTSRREHRGKYSQLRQLMSTVYNDYFIRGQNIPCQLSGLEKDAYDLFRSFIQSVQHAKTQSDKGLVLKN